MSEDWEAEADTGEPDDSGGFDGFGAIFGRVAKALKTDSADVPIDDIMQEQGYADNEIGRAKAHVARAAMSLGASGGRSTVGGDLLSAVANGAIAFVKVKLSGGKRDGPQTQTMQGVRREK